MEIGKTKKIALLIICILLAGFNFFVFAQNGDQKVNLALDSDHDGLTDAEEKTYGTNPNIADTDGDGYSDGIEVKSGYDPLKKAPGDKLSIANNIEKANAPETQGLTDGFIADLNSFITNKDEQNVSTTEINDFVNGSIQDKIGPLASFETLPTIDASKLKIKKQAYAGLNDSSRKEAEKKDAQEYLTNLVFLLIVNLSQDNTTEYNPNKLIDTFKTNLATLSTENPNYAYFREFSDKLQLFINQAAEMEVPETLADSHIKLLRVLQGYIALKDPSLPSIEDPMTRIIIISRARNLTDFAGEFIDSTRKDLLGLGN